MNATELRTLAGKYVDPTTAADIVQAIVIDLPRLLRQFDRRYQFRPWIRSIVINAAIDYQRSHNFGPGMPLVEALDSLAPGDREAYTAVHINRLTVPEAAESLGVPMMMVRARAARGLRLVNLRTGVAA